MSEQARVGRSSLHAEENPAMCPNYAHASWRVVRCDNDTDTIECSCCGQQREAACNFDEEFS